MHEKWFKIDFFANFRKLQKKLLICKKKYAEILHTTRAVVTNVEKKVKSTNRIFFTSAKVAPGCSIFAHFSAFLKPSVCVCCLRGLPDVHRYLSTFGGLLLMPLNLFDNLSDGRAPLVEVLGPILYSKIEAF